MFGVGESHLTSEDKRDLLLHSRCNTFSSARLETTDESGAESSYLRAWTSHIVRWSWCWCFRMFRGTVTCRARDIDDGSFLDMVASRPFPQ